MSSICGAAAPYVSIVIPCLNEARRLPATLERISEFLTAWQLNAELLVVDNGSTDGTRECVTRFAAENQSLNTIVVNEPRRGKGAAVRTGMLRACGEILFLCDADLSMPIAELEKFILAIRNGSDIAIGCRNVIGAARVCEPIGRKIMSRIFNSVIRLFGLVRVGDTQCGFKAFRRTIAQTLFQRSTIAGWAFDVEILALASMNECKISPIPIQWNYDPDSRIRPLWDSLAMLIELIKIRYRLRNGRAGTLKSRTWDRFPSKLRSQQAEDLWVPR